MVDAAANLSEHDPLIDANLTCMRIIWAIVLLYLAGVNNLTSLQILRGVEALSLLIAIFSLTIV